jgi:AraC-like DNA-binding protein
MHLAQSRNVEIKENTLKGSPNGGTVWNEAWQESSVWIALAFKSEFQAGRLATLCGVSMRTLQRRFASSASTTSSTITEWLQRVRLREAYARLKRGMRVKEVAYDLGYTQLSNFSRDFKKEYGITPSFLNGSWLPFEVRIMADRLREQNTDEALAITFGPWQASHVKSPSRRTSAGTGQS